MGNDRRLWGLATVAAGLLAGLALAPLGLPPLLWPSLALLWALAGSPPSCLGLRQGPLLAGGLWGLAAVLVSHRWLLWLHPLDWIGVPGPLSLPICLALWLGCGLLGGSLVMLWLALMVRLDATRASTALIGSLIWGLAEVQLARGPLFWFGLGSSALPGDRMLAGVAALAGAGAVAALQLLIAWCLWRALAPVPGRRRWLLAGLAIVAGAHLAGASALAAIAPEGGMAERLLVLQPAIPTRHKFEPRQQQALLRFLAAAQRLTAPASGNGEAMPGEGIGNVAGRAGALDGVSSLLLPEGSLALGQPLPLPAEVEVLSGGFRQEGLEQRSSLLRFDRGNLLANGWVDKHRLVPLGEWVPLASLWSWGGLSAVGGLEPASRASRLLARPAGSVAVAICYELSDGAALATASRQGAGWLLASANLDPYPLLLQQQFKALAQLRAIESGRWLVSAANTGPSMLIDARGRLVDQLPPGLRRTGVMELHRLSALTPYDRWGETPLLLLLLTAVTPRVLGSRRLR
jgi:apolipoprotein N-acyltransferase